MRLVLAVFIARQSNGSSILHLPGPAGHRIRSLHRHWKQVRFYHSASVFSWAGNSVAGIVLQPLTGQMLQSREGTEASLLQSHVVSDFRFDVIWRAFHSDAREALDGRPVRSLSHAVSAVLNSAALAPLSGCFAASRTAWIVWLLLRRPHWAILALPAPAKSPMPPEAVVNAVVNC